MALSRSGRTIVYANEVPYETDVLYTNLYKMVDVSNLAQAVLGGSGTSNASLASGLAATPHSPANLTINIANGVIYTLSELDATAYSTIPSDTGDFLYKPFTQVSTFNLAGFTPPGSGTLNYLVQAQGVTTDTDSTSRPFFNPSNPDNPIFQTVNQTRVDGITYSLLSAVSPAIPTPTAGWVGLYVVSVASGQTSITSGDISVYSAAPFITESLTQKISQSAADLRYLRPVTLQAGTPIYGNDTGTANNYAVTATPAYVSIAAGTFIYMRVSNTNTGPATLNVSGIGAIGIRKSSPIGLAPLQGNEMVSGSIAQLMHNGTFFELLNQANISSYSSSMTQANNQTIANNGLALLLWDTFDYIDNYGVVSQTLGASNNFTANVSGRYTVSGSVEVNAATSGNVIIFVYVNGVLFDQIVEVFVAGSTNNSIVFTLDLPLLATQYVQTYLTPKIASGNLTVVGGSLTNVFQIKYLGNN